MIHLLDDRRGAAVSAQIYVCGCGANVLVLADRRIQHGDNPEHSISEAERLARPGAVVYRYRAFEGLTISEDAVTGWWIDAVHAQAQP